MHVLTATAMGRERKRACAHLQGFSFHVCFYFLYCFFMLRLEKGNTLPWFWTSKENCVRKHKGSNLCKRRRVRSWRWPQQRQGQRPHWPGTQPQVPKQEKRSRSGDRNRGQPQSMITKEVPQWWGRSEVWPGRQASRSGPARHVAGHGRAAAELKRQNAKAQLKCCFWEKRWNACDEASRGSPQLWHSCFHSYLIQGYSCTTVELALGTGSPPLPGVCV